MHDSNLSMRITFGQVRFRFTGDAKVATEARMVDRDGGLLDAEIYGVGHHGSPTPTTPPFIDAVDPAVSIYSAGRVIGEPALVRGQHERCSAGR